MTQTVKSATELKRIILDLSGGETTAILSGEQASFLMEAMKTYGIASVWLQEGGGAMKFMDLFGEWSLNLELFESPSGESVLKTISGSRHDFTVGGFKDEQDRLYLPVWMGRCRRLHRPENDDFTLHGKCRRLEQSIEHGHSTCLGDMRSILKHLLGQRHWVWLDHALAGKVLRSALYDPWKGDCAIWRPKLGFPPIDNTVRHPDVLLYESEYDRPQYLLRIDTDMRDSYEKRKQWSFVYEFPDWDYEGELYDTIDLTPCGSNWLVHARPMSADRVGCDNSVSDREALNRYLIDKEC